jgi:[ribosomal protein S18]-alanine N-acetyltransferase
MIAELSLSSPCVRAMTLDDLPAVLVIDRASFSLPWPESAYRYELVSNETSICQVVETGMTGQGRQIIGMIVTWVILDEAHIATIATHPDYRQQGVARLLLVENLATAIARGARRAMLEVRESNLAAQNLYRQFGFESVGRRPHYYKDNGEDALLMTLPMLDEGYLAWLRNHQPSPVDCPAEATVSLITNTNPESRTGGEA